MAGRPRSLRTLTRCRSSKKGRDDGRIRASNGGPDGAIWAGWDRSGHDAVRVSDEPSRRVRAVLDACRVSDRQRTYGVSAPKRARYDIAKSSHGGALESSELGIWRAWRLDE